MDALSPHVAFRFAKRNLEQVLKSSLADLKSGSVESALRAIDEFWAFLEVGEEAGELGYNLVLEADWVYALGPRDKGRLKEIISETNDLRKWLRPYLTQGPVPKRMVDRFESLVQDVAWLDSKVHETDAEFSHGDFTIIPMPGISRPKLKGCLEALDKASDVIRRKFPKVLYGKVYVAKTLGKNAATYVRRQDTVQLSLRASATVGDVYALCHEFGHRYDHMFWKDRGQRETFMRLSTETLYETISFDKMTRVKLADEFIEVADAQRDGRQRSSSSLLTQFLGERLKMGSYAMREASQSYLADPTETNRKILHDVIALPSVATYEIRTDKVIREPIAVTPYGKTKWSENFAEAFAHYVMNKPLVPEIAAIMEQLA